MGASYNRVILIGNVTREVEVRYIDSGSAVTDIGLAINEKVKRGDEWVEETTFVDVTLWGRLAEVAGEYLAKGGLCHIEGRLRLGTWEKDGQKRSKLKVVGEKLTLLGGKPGGDGGQRERPEGVSRGQTRRAQKASEERIVGGGWGDGPPDDDIPFSWMIALCTLAASLSVIA